jgi:hypothetical protein
MEVDKSEINLLMMKIETIQIKNDQLNQNYKESLIKVHSLTSDL